MKPIYKEAYPHLFQPLILGKKKVEIKNRVFTAPMGCPLAQNADGRLNEYGDYFYGRFAWSTPRPSCRWGPPAPGP